MMNEQIIKANNKIILLGVTTCALIVPIILAIIAFTLRKKIVMAINNVFKVKQPQREEIKFDHIIITSDKNSHIFTTDNTNQIYNGFWEINTQK
jgi:hypothetical protein